MAPPAIAMVNQPTVLIVSDFPEITDNLRRYLLESEFTCKVLLESASACLLLCKKEQIDLILLDSNLQNSNCLEFLAKLQAICSNNCPQVIVIGDNDATQAVKALKSGAEDYLVKQQLTKEVLIKAVVDAVTKIKQPVCANELAELNQVEQALRKSEEKLSFILNNVNVSISRFCVFANRKWQYDYYSLGCETIFGYTSQELVADRNLWLSRVYPEDLENVIMPKFSDIFAELTINYEYRFYHKDGSLRWINATLTSQRDENQDVWYVTSVDSDITKQKEVEAALRESQSRFERLAANVPGMIYQYVLHSNGNDAFTYVSPKSRRIYELEPFELQQNSANVWAMIHPDDVSKVQEANQIASQHLVNFDVEFRLITPNGHIKWVHAKSQPEPQTNGDVLFDGLVTDITERKRAELALQQSEALFRGIFESDLIGILFWNMEGQITDANNAFIKMTGYSREDMQAGKVYYKDITPQEYHQLDTEKFQLLLKGESYVPFEKEYICKNGTHLPILIGCAFLPGFTDRGVAFVLDISEQKRLRQEKETLLEKAETARTEAEVANHTKDEFLAIVSHELRSPLNSILGWAKLMQTRKLDEAGKLRALQTIERNAKAQAQLIEDLLDISRMIRGNLRLNLAPVNLINIVEAAIDIIVPLAQVKQIHLESHLDTTIGYVSGDCNRLQQIFINLLTNAVKFTPTRGKVEVSLLVNNSHNAQFIVTDTGKGIAGDFLPHVFERFRRADSTTTRSKDGLGLGLAIVYNLVELHGGTVTAASPGVGMGATFTVTLPILNTEAPQLPQTAENTEISLSGVNLLVVDDDKDCCEFLEFILRNSGAQVKTATSVVEAFIILQDFHPNIIISDISMPEQDGYTFLQHLRSNETQNKIPAIALTANVSEEDKQKAIKAGFQFHLSKPVDPETLLNTITKIINRSTGILAVQ